ncbi:hypothetical protein [Catenuloplanes japonicus]|uniref:hypothetical protein n=1 Tax=Catenuloplanes japonicus TaxID=33876 RepID=UPI000AD02E33|nr:hypothetical protein [Catenuloplanes japonicus]
MPAGERALPQRLVAGAVVLLAWLAKDAVLGERAGHRDRAGRRRAVESASALPFSLLSCTSASISTPWWYVSGPLAPAAGHLAARASINERADAYPCNRFSVARNAPL